MIKRYKHIAIENITKEQLDEIGTHGWQLVAVRTEMKIVASGQMSQHEARVNVFYFVREFTDTEYEVYDESNEPRSESDRNTEGQQNH